MSLRRRTLISMISKRTNVPLTDNLPAPEPSEKSQDRVVQEEHVLKVEEPPALETVEPFPAPAQIVTEDVLEEVTQPETLFETEIAPEPLEEVEADDPKKKKSKRFGKD
jgi:hypothetical protein